jgi:hypothetical protein
MMESTSASRPKNPIPSMMESTSKTKRNQPCAIAIFLKGKRTCVTPALTRETNSSTTTG